MLFDGGKNGAAGFVRVGAVVEAAVFREAEYLLEIRANLFRLHIECAEALDARGVYHPAGVLSGVREREHLREGGGVHASVVGIGNLRRAQVGTRKDGVEER